MVRYPQASAEELLKWALATFGDEFAICTSFQKEGMVILDIASRISPDVRVFTLDTGRLPNEPYEIMETVRQRYGVEVEVVYPDAAELESMVTSHGPNLFYRDVSLRMLCCQIRKVRPLERKLRTLKAWAAGLRRGQSELRAEVRKVEQKDGVLKLSPLADWTAADVERYIQEHSVPIHPLYSKGYTSIGCAPCTRPAGPGENERDGRWWWESDAAKECGIHFTPDGRSVPKVDVLMSEILVGREA